MISSNSNQAVNRRREPPIEICECGHGTSHHEEDYGIYMHPKPSIRTCKCEHFKLFRTIGDFGLND